MIYGGHFDIAKKKEDIQRLEEITLQSDFWNDRDKATKIIDEMNGLKEIVTKTENILAEIKNNLDIVELLLIESDEELLKNIEEETNLLSKKISELEIFLLLSGPYDKNNCLLEIHSGAGGTEACDWADMLFRMYLRYLERHKFKYEVLSYLDGDEVGLKSASIKITGNYAYGYLKGEKGVHRLVRLSPFDTNHKRHTSFASVDITPEFNNDIDVSIDEKDLKIDVYRSSGAGGQHVNTTDSAVRITHIPTGIVTSSQVERSQLRNKEIALEMLRNKLYVLQMKEFNDKLKDLKGDVMDVNFGSAVRSYVMCPYTLVKDNRTNYETSDVNGVLDGDIHEFLEAFLKI